MEYKTEMAEAVIMNGGVHPPTLHLHTQIPASPPTSNGLGSPSPSQQDSPILNNNNNGKLPNANANTVADYLSQLIKDKRSLSLVPNMFMHTERLLDDEIHKVRQSLCQLHGTSLPLSLPDPQGTITTLTEKVYVPVREYPDFNFVGRILGPRGMTAKLLEQQTGCKIMVRGKGSVRDKQEEMNKGKPKWEHLNDELHVLITCEDTPNRATQKIQRAVDEVKKLLVPQPEGEDDLKKRQLMELAILNGTYRESGGKPPQKMQVAGPTIIQAMRGPITAATLQPQQIMPGPPFITSMSNSHAAMLAAMQSRPILGSPAEPNLFSLPYEYMPYAAAAAAGLAPALLEYNAAINAEQQSNAQAAGGVSKVRRFNMRDHPYQRTQPTSERVCSNSPIH